MKFIAPTILHDGSKHLKDSPCHWDYNPDILSYIIKNSTKNQLALMLYYLGNKDGWVCSDLGEKIGLTDKGNFSRTRQELEKKGWITYSQTDKTVTVHLDTLYFLVKPSTQQNLAKMGF